MAKEISNSIYRVASSVEVGQQLSHDKILGIVDHQVHDRLGHQISRGLGHDFHVRIDQITNSFNLDTKRERLHTHVQHIQFFSTLLPVAQVGDPLKRNSRDQQNLRRWWYQTTFRGRHRHARKKPSTNRHHLESRNSGPAACNPVSIGGKKTNENK